MISVQVIIENGSSKIKWMKVNLVIENWNAQERLLSSKRKKSLFTKNGFGALSWVQSTRDFASFKLCSKQNLINKLLPLLCLLVGVFNFQTICCHTRLGRMYGSKCWVRLRIEFGGSRCTLRLLPHSILGTELSCIRWKNHGIKIKWITDVF